MPSAMVPLALLLMVQQQTGSYAVAGATSATLGIAMAVMAPVLGRLADPRGPPLVSGTVRAVWSRVDPRVRPTAYALDATVTELVFVAGPTAVAALTVFATPAVAGAGAGALAIVGALGIAVSGAMRAWVPAEGPRTGVLTTVLAPGMPRILLSGSALMLGFGGPEGALPAVA